MTLLETHLSAGQIDPDEYRAILLGNLEGLSDLTDEGVDATLTMLADLQTEVRRTIVDIATPPTRVLYEQALDGINQSIVNFGNKYGFTLSRLQDRGFNIGTAIAIDPLGNTALAGLEGISRTVPPEIAALFSRFSADLVQGVTQQVRTRINAEVIGVLAGAKTPQQAAAAIGRNLTDANHFTSVAARARAITVTEIGRASAVGTQGAQQDLARQIADDPDLDIKVQKRWINAHLPGARPEHLAAERRYHPDGPVGPIPIDEPYSIAGFAALYPRDPSLPAAQSVHCHCQSITWIPEMMEADPLEGHQADLDDAMKLKGFPIDYAELDYNLVSQGLVTDDATLEQIIANHENPAYMRASSQAALQLKRAGVSPKVWDTWAGGIMDAELGPELLDALINSRAADSPDRKVLEMLRSTIAADGTGNAGSGAFMPNFPEGNADWRWANNEVRKTLKEGDQRDRLDASFDQWWDRLSEDQRAIVKAYTTSAYEPMNIYLEEGLIDGEMIESYASLLGIGVENQQDLEWAIQELQAAIELQPDVGDVYSWRRIHDGTSSLKNELDAAMISGDNVVHDAFGSTSIDTAFIKDPGKSSVVLEIKSSSGAWLRSPEPRPIQGADFRGSTFDSEYEWLIAAGNEYRVVGKIGADVEGGLKRITIYQLEEVVSGFDDPTAAMIARSMQEGKRHE